MSIIKSQVDGIEQVKSLEKIKNQECHYLYENILGCRTNLSKEEMLEVIRELQEEFQSELNVNKDRRSFDSIKKYSDELKSITVETSHSYLQNKEKQFYSYLKLDNRTRYFNTALNDDMTQTMYAYYFCDKSRQILSDKEAAAIKAITIDNNYDPIDDNLGVSGKYFRNNDDDQFSNLSNSNSNMFMPPINDKESAQLKRKRKYSTKGIPSNKRGTRKTQKFGNKQTPYEDNDEENSKVADNKDDCEEDDDKEYCIQDCLMGRKYQEVDMIACDACNNWFHPKCIKMSNEEFKRFQLLSWHCDDCKE